jgi:predicted ArsR family transcriptional regulator
MQRVEFPEEVLRFIERRIDSVPHLETLLLLWEKPATEWSESDIAARVYISSEKARSVLQDLARHGLITAGPSERYSYNTTWDESRLMDKVAASYRSHLVRLAGLIHAKAGSQAVRDFARAFHFKTED